MEAEKKIGIRHLIECNCILPQFMNLKEKKWHRFPVFSIIDENDNVIPKYTLCNNCGINHKVLEIGKSEITRKDSIRGIKNIEDIKFNLPLEVVSILEPYEHDISTWEELEFIWEEKKFGSFVIIDKEMLENGEQLIKIVKLMEGIPPRFKVETVIEKDFIS